MRMINYLLTGLLALSSLVFFSSCQKDGQMELIGEAEVSLEKLSVDNFTKMRIQFTPSENTKYVKFAIGSENDREAFRNDILEGTLTQDGNQPFEYTFENLQANEDYTVFAVAYDENEKAGTVTSIKSTPKIGEISLQMQYLTDNSAAFKYSCESTIASCRYYLGTEEDREAFLNEEVESQTLADIYIEYTVNFFGLEPSKDYILFAIAKDIAGASTELVEIPFTTYAADDNFPNLSKDLQVTSKDAYGAYVELTPNDLCGKMTAYLCPKGEYDWNINQWKGDILSMFESKGNSGELPSAKDGAVLSLNYTDKKLVMTDVDYDVYVLFYDTEYNPVAAKKYYVEAYTFNEGAGTAECTSVKQTSISGNSVTYDITLNENAAGAYYNTFIASFYEDEEANSSNNEFWASEYLLQKIENYMVHGKTEFSFTDNTVQPSSDYYIVVCPFNKNGVLGWGPVFAEKFTTPAK